MRIGVKSHGDELKWVEAKDIEIDGVTLENIFAQSHLEKIDTNNKIAALEEKIEKLSNRQYRFVNIFKPKTAEGGAKK